MSRKHADALVIFGVTGDLAHRKIFPSLYALERRGALNVPIVGIARQEMTTENLRVRARDGIERFGGGEIEDEVFERLASRIQYVLGDYSDPESFKRLRIALGEAKHPLHYLAVPPSIFGMVTANIAAGGCADGASVVVDQVIDEQYDAIRDALVDAESRLRRLAPRRHSLTDIFRSTGS